MPRPEWPTSKTPKPWLETTAAWALLLPPCAESRHYAHFAMEALAELGAKSSVVRIADALIAKPCKTDALCSVSDLEAIAKVYVALGDDRRAAAAMTRFDPILATQRKKSDVEFVKNSRSALEKELAALKKQRRPARTRATPADRPRAVGTIMREMRAAFAELTPDEWNVHNPAGDLSRAVRELHARGDVKKADAVLTQTLAAFATGAHDGRGFASGAAYVALARATFDLRGRAAAVPLLEKALAVAGKHRQMIIGDAALTYAAIGLVDEGLALAQKVRPEARRADTVAQILYRAKAWAALRKELGRVRNPEVGAKIAWTLASIALDPG